MENQENMARKNHGGKSENMAKSRGEKVFGEISAVSDFSVDTEISAVTEERRESPIEKHLVKNFSLYITLECRE